MAKNYVGADIITQISGLIDMKVSNQKWTQTPQQRCMVSSHAKSKKGSHFLSLFLSGGRGWRGKNPEVTQSCWINEETRKKGFLTFKRRSFPSRAALNTTFLNSIMTIQILPPFRKRDYNRTRQ